jgi:Ca-activated chloride channel family protein
MKGRVLILCLGLLATPSWAGFWATPNQEGQGLMMQKKYKEAQEHFEDKDWAGAAAFKAGDYNKAAESFKETQSQYNLGNALTHLGQYEAAIKAYDQALKANPKDEDAAYNRKLVESFLNHQQQNQDKQNEQPKDKQEEQKQKNEEQQKQNNEGQNDKDAQQKPQSKEQNPKEPQQKPQHKEQEEKKKQNKEQNDKKPQQKPQTKEQQEKDKQSKEQQHAKEQWLKLIPDDPGGLLRGKFLRDHLRRSQGDYE